MANWLMKVVTAPKWCRGVVLMLPGSYWDGWPSRCVVSHPGQLSEVGNEYRPKWGEALWMVTVAHSNSSLTVWEVGKIMLSSFNSCLTWNECHIERAIQIYGHCFTYCSLSFFLNCTYLAPASGLATSICFGSRQCG